MRKKVDRVLGSFLVVLLVIMVLSVLWQIFSRYLLNSPSSFTEELARYLFIWIGILGAAYASGQQTHLSIDILPTKLNPPNRIKLRIFINILIILFSITVLVIGGGNLVYVNDLLGQSSAALEVPLSWVYSIVPVSGLLVVFYKVHEIIYSKTYLV